MLFHVIFLCICIFSSLTLKAEETSSKFPSIALKNQSLAILHDLNKAITLSNFLAEEREQNLQYSQKALDTLKFLSDKIDISSEHFPDYLQLTYKLANCLQQNDRPAEAEIILELALKQIQSKLPQAHNIPATDLCAALSSFHPRLPSLYAALLHYQAKSYFYQKNTPLKKGCGEEEEYQLKQALDIRSIIDNNPKTYEEPADSGQEGFYCSHTIVFLRTLGYFYNEKGNIASSRTIYEQLFSQEDPFEKMLAALQLISVFSHLACQECNLEKTHLYYELAHDKALFVENYIETHSYSGLPNACIGLSNFYANLSNPFYDIIKAKEFLEKSVFNQRSFSLERTLTAEKRLSAVYQKIAKTLEKDHEKKTQDLQESYFSSKTSSLQKSEEVRIAAIIKTASLYRVQKKFLEATLLLSNVLPSIHENLELKEEIWTELFLVEKEFLKTLDNSHVRLEAELTFSSYKNSINRYKKSLQEARNRFKKTVNVETSLASHHLLSADFTLTCTSIFKEILFFMQPPPSSFAFMGAGSLARGILSPYSDLEFILVHEAKSPIQRQYFNKLSTFFLLRLLAIGETPVSSFISESSLLDMAGFTSIEGFMPDQGGLISHSFGKGRDMSGSPKILVSAEESLILLMELRNSTLLFGSEKLAEELKMEAQKKLRAIPKEKHESILLNDVKAFSPLAIKVNEQGKICYSIKHMFFRGITTILSSLACHHSIVESRPERILSKLADLDVISEETRISITALYQEILFLRSFHYLASGSHLDELVLTQDEWSVFFDLECRYTKALDELLKNLPYKKKPTNPTLKFLQAMCSVGLVQEVKSVLPSLLDNSIEELLGDIATVQQNPQKALSHYLTALQNNPDSVFLLLKCSESLISSGNIDSAEFYLTQAKELIPTSENPKLAMISVKYLQAVSVRKQNKWEVLESLLHECLIDKDPFLKEESLIEALWKREYGLLEQYKGDFESAEKYLEKAKSIIKKKYGSCHPYLLPIYLELLQCIQPDNLAKRQVYEKQVELIKGFFPNMQLLEPILDR